MPAATPSIPIAGPGSVPQLSFSVEDAGPLDFAAAPTVRFGLRIEAGATDVVRSVLLTTQIRIAAQRRPYGPDEKERLNEVFGEPSRWGTTLRSLLWKQTTLVVPPFTGSTLVDMPVECTYDLAVSSAGYLQALGDGEVPLEFLFSGTVFYSSAEGLLRTGLIPWDREAGYRLPVGVLKETMDQHFRGSAWLRVSRETFDRLYAYRASRVLGSFDETLDGLLDRAEADESDPAGEAN